MYYFYIQNNNIIGKGMAPCTGEGLINVETTEEIFNDYEQDKYIYQDGEVILNPQWQTVLYNRRQDNFENQFLTLSENKNYRLTPKGYANAQQSIDTVNNMVAVSGSLTQQIATMILFYETPDFSKEKECTEEWLIQHQYSCEPMTKEEWASFYVDFTTKYAEKMYQQGLKSAS